MNVLSGTDEPETEIVVAVVRGVVVPVRNRTVVGVVVPATTTFEAVGARRSAATTLFLWKLPFFITRLRGISFYYKHCLCRHRYRGRTTVLALPKQCFFYGCY